MKIYNLGFVICILLCCWGCRDYSRVYLGGNSAEEVMKNVEKNKDILDKINNAYINKKDMGIYEWIDLWLINYWASPEIMTKWYKIRLESIQKSDEKFNTKKYINQVSCQALIWFIRTNDRKAIEKLPVLVEFPLFEKVKNQYSDLYKRRKSDD